MQAGFLGILRNGPKNEEGFRTAFWAVIPTGCLKGLESRFPEELDRNLGSRAGVIQD